MPEKKNDINPIIAFIVAISFRKPTKANSYGLLRVYNTTTMVCIALLNIFPLISLITIVKGIKRLKSNYLRYFNGKLNLISVPAEECPEDDVKQYKNQAKVYILIAILAILLKGFFFVQYANRMSADYVAEKQQTEQLQQWNTYTSVSRDDFTEQETTRTFEYIYPIWQNAPLYTKNALYTKYVLVKDNGLYLYYMQEAHIPAYNQPQFKIYQNGKQEIITADMEKNMVEQHDNLTLSLYNKEYKYNARYLLKGQLGKQIAAADSVIMRVSEDKLYKFTFSASQNE